MLVKTSDLTGAALDWAVALCENKLPASYDNWAQTWPPYSSVWNHGGPLMEREGITVWEDPHYYGGLVGTPRYLASKNVRAVEGQYYSTLTGSDPATIEGEHTHLGETYLVAAMRCLVQSQHGSEVDVPEELLS